MSICLSRELHAIVFAEAMNEALRLNTYLAHLELAHQRVIDCEVGLGEVAAWRAERFHFRESLSYARRQLRRRAIDRVRRVHVTRIERAWIASMFFEELADAIEESSKRYVSELAAAREAIEELEKFRIARGSRPDM